LGPSILFGYEIFSAGGVQGHSAKCKFGTLHISETTRARNLKFLHTFRWRQVLFSGMKFFSGMGHPGRAAPPSVNLGPPHISETTVARKLKLYIHLDEPSTLFGYENFSARGRVGDAVPPSVNLGPPHI